MTDWDDRALAVPEAVGHAKSNRPGAIHRDRFCEFRSIRMLVHAPIQECPRGTPVLHEQPSTSDFFISAIGTRPLEPDFRTRCNTLGVTLPEFGYRKVSSPRKNRRLPIECCTDFGDPTRAIGRERAFSRGALFATRPSRWSPD